MKRIENECVGCPTGVPCLGPTCPNRNVVRYYCDECHEEDYPLWHYDGKELCTACLLENFEIVEGTDI